ncbi:hypothetical protein [Desulfobulbus sp.]|uniref:hypothetical protein n=1 Tax=Desulfobulbus sp. TaxID=895 RepID=UPI00286F6553|nr:hypothetical protein [Desulfobulbus sp.]
MRIVWQIEKQRGNYRPSLNFTLELEEYEQRLAVEAVNVRSLIPRIEAPHQMYCLPGRFERAAGWCPLDYHWLAAPFFRDGSRHGFIRLPFRESGSYPEVEQSFTLLRETHEEVVRQAYSWEPISESHRMDISPDGRRAIAAKLTAERLLAF